MTCGTFGVVCGTRPPTNLENSYLYNFNEATISLFNIMITGSNYRVGDVLSNASLHSFISEQQLKKDIICGRNSGSKRRVYICKDCKLFSIIAAKRSEDSYCLRSVQLEHGDIQEDGLQVPCAGLAWLQSRRLA